MALMGHDELRDGVSLGRAPPWLSIAPDARPIVSGWVVRICLATVIATLVATALYTYWMNDRQQDWSEDFAGTASAASEVALALRGFEDAVVGFSASRDAGALAEMKTRFGELYDRARLLHRRAFLRFIDTDPEYRRLLGDLDAAIGGLDPVMAEAGPSLDTQQVLDTVRPFQSRMLGLAADANRYGTDRLSRAQQSLARLHSHFSGLSFALILCELCLVAALAWHNRLLTRTHRDLSLRTRDLKRTAEELAAANRLVEAANRELRHKNERLSEKERALQSQNLLFDAALNNMSQGLCMFDAGLRPLVSNRQFEQLFGVDRFLRRKSPEGDRSSLHALLPDIAPAIALTVRKKRAALFETERPDGRIIAVAQQPMAEGAWVATFEDVTERRRAQARIIQMARHDGLTGLPNRYAFHERVEAELAAVETAGGIVAVMCIDVDNFKGLNDSLGHRTGDVILCAVAERLASCLDRGDMVARIGGDEFAILQSRVTQIEDVERLAKCIVDRLRKPFHIDGERLYATGSVGIAAAPWHGSEPDVLQKKAGLALNAAKADGKRIYRFFDDAMGRRLAHRQALERDLRTALAEHALDVHYQPIIDLKTMRMTGVEALARWTHPEHGPVPPSEFIPVAEDAGLIGELGRAVLAEACADAARWPAHLKLAVNLSVAQFAQGDVVEDIRAALSRAGLRPDRLVIEITESFLLDESASTLEALRRLKLLQIEIAMDDFGTGYSSLNYLRRYPFDSIKIDRQFVVAARKGGKDSAIVRAIVELGRKIGMTTVAEGVETEEDLAMLLELGCAEGQGYLFGRPLPREEIEEVIAADARRRASDRRMEAA